MSYVIRPVNADDWRKARELRLAALADPVAHVAFLESLAEAAARPDAFWQERTANSSCGTSARQFVAEAPGGEWGGTVVVLVERPGDQDVFGQPVRVAQAHLVGVFVRAKNRGSGLIGRLCDAAVDWAWSLDEPVVGRLRLFVHEDNPRAAGFYRKFGFVPTGVAMGSDHEMQLARPGGSRGGRDR